ncbi:oxidoreductase [Mobilicoccus pelagius]|uniref:Putative oxidoreductase n=1 Tax=Mobilicoccus pelagius NBRC 104925 TaxID=1089455 RepID=H5UNN4_9MICO|nr:oxidoreductase [Mobilicoccus pelagius]GAB47342.1 putative oxidoreductase [Mobilicoccus pelagius NBRC 104925]
MTHATLGAPATSAHEQRPLRVGLASFGMVSRVFHAPLVRAADGFELAAIVSSDAGKVRAAHPDVRHLPDVDALLGDPDIDVVVVTTPNDTHVPLTLAAVEAGKHVVVEKPVGLDHAEALRLADAANDAAERGLVVTAFHNRRWDGDFLSVQDALADGRPGRPVTLHSHFDRFRPEPRDRWRENGGPGSGLWLDLGPHLVDQARVLFGAPEWVQADIATIRDGARANDYADVTLAFPGGVRAILHATTLAAATPPRLVLHGTGGSLVVEGLDPQEAQLGSGIVPTDRGYGLAEGAQSAVLLTDGTTPTTIPRRAGEYPQFYARLHAAITRGEAPPVSMRDAAEVMRIIEAAIRSAETGARVPLRRTSRPDEPGRSRE